MLAYGLKVPDYTVLQSNMNGKNPTILMDNLNTFISQAGGGTNDKYEQLFNSLLKILKKKKMK